MKETFNEWYERQLKEVELIGDELNENT